MACWCAFTSRMASQGNNAVRVMYADSEFAENGPQGKSGNNNPGGASTVSDNGSAMQLTITIGTAQFPIVVSTEDFWDQVAPIAFVPIVVDLHYLTASDLLKIGVTANGGNFNMTRAVKSMEVTFNGLLSNLETPDPSAPFGVDGNTVGRAKTTVSQRVDVSSNVGQARLFVGRHGDPKMKRLQHKVAYASLSSRRRHDRPVHRGGRFSLSVSQLEFPHYVLPLVVMLHVSYRDGGDQVENIAFTSDHFAVAYRLDATMSLVFPQTSQRLHRVRAGDRVSLLRKFAGSKQSPLTDWIDDALKYQNDAVAMKDQEAAGPRFRQFVPAVFSSVNETLSGTDTDPTILIPGRNRLVSRIGVGGAVTLHRYQVV